MTAHRFVSVGIAALDVMDAVMIEGQSARLMSCRATPRSLPAATVAMSRSDARGTEIGAAVRLLSFAVVERRGNGDIEQLAAEGELVSTPAIGEETVMANAVKPIR